MYASTKVHIAYIYDRFPATFCVAPALQNPPIASLRVQDRWVMVERSIFCPVSTFAWITGRFSSRSVFTGSRSSIGPRLFIGNAAARQENRLNDCLIKYVLVVEWALHCYCRNSTFLSAFFFFSSLSFSIFFHLWTNIVIQRHLRRLRTVPLSWIKIYHFGERTSPKFYYFHWLCPFRSIWNIVLLRIVSISLYNMNSFGGKKYVKPATFGSCSLTCRLRLY